VITEQTVQSRPITFCLLQNNLLSVLKSIKVHLSIIKVLHMALGGYKAF